jgi:hypothetical protein
MARSALQCCVEPINKSDLESFSLPQVLQSYMGGLECLTPPEAKGKADKKQKKQEEPAAV